MQKITLLCVGKLKEPFYIDAVAEYTKRLCRHCKLEIVELPECRMGDNPTPGEIQQALRQEADAITAKLPKGTALIAMCIEGKQLSSVALSEQMAQMATQGASSLTFLIGGSVGLAERLKTQAALKLSMSPMTFPHHLARIMLLEQIYRGFQIQVGSKYHK